MIKYFIKIAEQKRNEGDGIDYMAIKFLVWNSIPVYIVAALVMSAVSHSILFGTLVAVPMIGFYFFIIYCQCKKWL